MHSIDMQCVSSVACVEKSLPRIVYGRQSTCVKEVSAYADVSSACKVWQGQGELHLGHAQLTEGILQVPHNYVEVRHAQALLVVQPPMADGRILSNVLLLTSKRVRQEPHLSTQATILQS